MAVRPKWNRLLLPLRTMLRMACLTKLGGGVLSLAMGSGIGLTAMGFLSFITLVAWLGRPTLPG